MPQLTFQVSSKVDVNQIISASELKKLFLSGIPLDKLDQIDEETYNFYINAAIDFVQQQVTVKLNKTIITETHDYSADDFRQWGYIRCTYPAVACVSINGFLGNSQQVQYPKEWVICKRDSDGRMYSRNIALIPSRNSTVTQMAVYTGIIPMSGIFSGNSSIPGYWEVTYVTGFDVIPQTIVNVVGMLAAIPILMLLNDLIVKGNKNFPGIGFGVTSNSISLDGLSQNVGSYVNGQSTIFSAKIKQMIDLVYNGDRGMLKTLSEYYGAIIMSSC